jgi:hypothetical protein
MTAKGSIGRGAPRLATVSTAKVSPFGYVPTSELLPRPKHWLEFEIPSDTMRLSEACAWATAKALGWASARKTVIVEPVIDWRVDGMTIAALVTLTCEPKTSRVRKAKP